jgi:LCP family protein required for cell wall assembly
MQIFRKILVGVFSIGIVIVTAGTVYAAHLFQTTSDTFDEITSGRKSDMRSEDVSIADSEPFSILLMGIDTGALGRTEQGRSDSMMVVTVNPTTKQSTIVSLDRDILTNMVGYEPNGTAYFDKLNHAYAFGSVDMAMDTIETLLDIPLDHYVSINMEGLSDLIDAVGGIEVDNKIDFTLDGVHVPIGKQTLNGETGLAYARMRHEDPDGDIGRQKRQREVVEKILRKVLSMDSVTNYQKILKAVKSNVLTDLSFNEMLTIGKNYTAAFDSVKSYQLQGESQTINDVYYQILGVNELLSIQNTLKNQLNLTESAKLVINQDFYYSTNGLLGDQFYDDTDYTSASEYPYEFGDKSSNNSTTTTSDSTSQDSEEVVDNTNQ